MNVWEKMDDAFLYGPLPHNEIGIIMVPHRIIEEPEGFYVGTAIPQPQWDNFKITIPVSNSENQPATDAPQVTDVTPV